MHFPFHRLQLPCTPVTWNLLQSPENRETKRSHGFMTSNRRLPPSTTSALLNPPCFVPAHAKAKGAHRALGQEHSEHLSSSKRRISRLCCLDHTKDDERLCLVQHSKSQTLCIKTHPGSALPHPRPGQASPGQPEQPGQWPEGWRRAGPGSTTPTAGPRPAPLPSAPPGLPPEPAHVPSVRTARQCSGLPSGHPRPRPRRTTARSHRRDARPRRRSPRRGGTGTAAPAEPLTPPPLTAPIPSNSLPSPLASSST